MGCCRARFLASNHHPREMGPPAALLSVSAYIFWLLRVQQIAADGPVPELSPTEAEPNYRWREQAFDVADVGFWSEVRGAPAGEYFAANDPYLSQQASSPKRNVDDLLDGTVSYERDRTIRPYQKVRLPARRACAKGTYDAIVEACVWLDRQDKILPNYECPPGSVLNGDFCYGRIVADYELDCPKNFLPNEDEVCVKAIVYTPPQIVCPEGFAVVSVAPSSRSRMCKRVKYVAPIRRPVETVPRVEMAECSGEEKKCPFPAKPVADRQWVLECPDGGKLVRSKKDRRRKACKVNVLVPPMPAKNCVKGFRALELVNFGIGCVKLAVEDVALVCPGPKPKLGPGFGEWDVPRYKYDPVDKCVAYRAKATEGQCPFGYEFQQDTCYRKYFLPYYTDCNNIEGYAFFWDPHLKQGFCEYQFDPFKWTPGVSYVTQRERWDAGRLHLLSNPYHVKRAYENSADIAAAFRPPPAGPQLEKIPEKKEP